MRITIYSQYLIHKDLDSFQRQEWGKRIPKNASDKQGWQEYLQHHPKTTIHLGARARKEAFVGNISLVCLGYRMEENENINILSNFALDVIYS